MRLPLRRRNVIALSEDLPTNVVPSATMINTKEAGNFAAASVALPSMPFWQTVQQYGLDVSGDADLKRLRALFFDVFPSPTVATMAGRRPELQPLPPLPTDEDIAALAAEVRQLDQLSSSLSGMSTRRRRHRARAASPPPPSSEAPAEQAQQLEAASSSQMAEGREQETMARQATKSGEVEQQHAKERIYGRLVGGSIPEQSNGSYVPRALLERCELIAAGEQRAIASGLHASIGELDVEVDLAAEVHALRALLGNLAAEFRHALDAPLVDGGRYMHGRPMSDAHLLAGARHEREELAGEIIALVHSLQKGARHLQAEKCDAAASAAVANALKEADEKALVVAQEMQEESLRAAAGGGGSGSDGPGLVPGLPPLASATLTSEELKQLTARELAAAELLAGVDDAAAIGGAATLAALDRRSLHSREVGLSSQGPHSYRLSAKRAVELLRRPPPANACLPLLMALGRVCSLNGEAAAAACEADAIELLHRFISDPSSVIGGGTAVTSPLAMAIRAAACVALGEVIDAMVPSPAAATSPSSAPLPEALETALGSSRSQIGSQASPAEKLVHTLLRVAGLASSGGDDVRGGGDRDGAKRTTMRTVEAVACAALASLLRVRAATSSLVPTSSVTSLIERISIDGEGSAGVEGVVSRGEGPRIGELALANSLRQAGVDVGRALRTSRGWTRFIGMLDAPPPNTATAAGKAALQIDRLLRAEMNATYGSQETVVASNAVGLVGSNGHGACAVAGHRSTLQLAVHCLGGISMLCERLCGPGKRPPATLSQAPPPRTLAAIAGCLEMALSGSPLGQVEAVRCGIMPVLVKLLSLSRADLRRPGKGGIGELEPDLLPNLVLAITALVTGAPPNLAASLRAAGGIETLTSMLEMRTAGGPSELHILTLQALHAAGETCVERSAAILLADLAPRSKLTPRPAIEAAATVRAIKTLGALARPLLARE